MITRPRPAILPVIRIMLAAGRVGRFTRLATTHTVEEALNDTAMPCRDRHHISALSLSESTKKEETGR